MNKKAYVFSRNCLLGQQMTIVFSGLIVLIGFASVLFDRGFWAWTSLAVVLLGLIGTNLVAAKVFKVQKEGDSILIENMWRRKSYPVTDLAEIRLLRLAIPYPFSPYLKFTFKNGESYVGLIPHSFWVYVRHGGIRGYLEDVRKEWS